MSLLIKRKVLTKYIPVNTFSSREFYLAERLFFNNFVVFDYKSIGLKLPDKLIKGSSPNAVYTEALQRKLNKFLIKEIVLISRVVYLFSKRLKHKIVNMKLICSNHKHKVKTQND